MSHTPAQVEEIFNQVCDMTPDRRREHLSSACAGNDNLLKDVESLLSELDSDVTGIIASAVSDAAPDDAAPDHLPERIGEFRVVRRLGEGGMARVYEAVQESPFRVVALKVIRTGLFSRPLLSRFRREADVLAQLKHPGIAQLLQVGSFTLADGQTQPYLAMELVQGVTITEYVRSRAMDVRPRLDLIARTCDAVQHAHQRGVIHRDLKPANVLVEDAGSDSKQAASDLAPLGQPKVLDFGIARLVKAGPGSHAALSMHTEVGQIVGTLAYMSPEQASGDSRVIDTRSDVYALGVLAYELITGRVPIEVTGKPVTLALKLIHEHQPAPLGALVPALRGDAELIIAKALDKDPDRRYSSAGELAADIRRFLRNEPIVARPASMVYTLRKFSRRHRAALAGGSAAVLGIIASLSYGLVQTRTQRDRAINAERETALRADQLQKVSDFQARMLAQVDPAVAGQLLTANVNAMYNAALIKAGETDADRDTHMNAFAAQWSKVSATDAAQKLIDSTILTPATTAIDKQFADQPVVAATLQFVIGGRYMDLGIGDRGIDLLTMAAETRKQALGENHPETLMAYKALGNALPAAGKLDESERILLRTLEQSRLVLGPEHEETLYAMNSLAVTYMHQGRFADAEKLTSETVATARRVLGENHPQFAAMAGNYAGVLQQQGKAAEAEKWHRETVEQSRRSLGEDNPLTLQAEHNLAHFLIGAGRYEEAGQRIRDVLERRRRVLGADHPGALSSLSSLGTLTAAQGATADAERIYREVLAARRRTVGDDDPATLDSLAMLVTLLLNTGQAEQAEPLARESMEMHRRILGENHPRTLIARGDFAVLLMNQRQFEEAEEIGRDVLEKRRSLLGADHADTLVALNVIASILERQGKLEAAEPYFREAIATCRRTIGSEHPSAIIVLNNLGALLWTTGKLAEANEILHEAGGAAERIHGPRHATTLVVKLKLGGVLIDLKRFSEALDVLAPFEAMASESGGLSPRTAGVLFMRLGAARAGLSDFAKAEANLVQAHSILLALNDASSPNLRNCTKFLADLYAAWNEAEPGTHETHRLEWRDKLEALAERH